jgi:hypothetical protein
MDFEKKYLKYKLKYFNLIKKNKSKINNKGGDVSGNLVILSSNHQTPPSNHQTPPSNHQTPPRYDQTPPRYDQTPPRYDQTSPGYDQTPPRNYQLEHHNIRSVLEYASQSRNLPRFPDFSPSPIPINFENNESYIYEDISGNQNPNNLSNYSIDLPVSNNLLSQFNDEYNHTSNIANEELEMEIDVNYELEFIREFSLNYKDYGDLSSMVEIIDGNIATINGMGNKIQIFDISGNLIYKFSIEDNVDSEIKLSIGITCTPNNEIAIVDSTNNRVRIFDISGNFIRTFGSSGNNDNQFLKPCDITILSDNNFGIVDKYNNRIQIFDISGNFVRNFYCCSLPNYITQLSNNIISVKNDSNQLCMYDLSGNLLITKNLLDKYVGCYNGNLIELSDKHIGILDIKSINVFDKSGNFIKKLKLHNDDNDDNNNNNKCKTHMIKLSNNNILVLDSYENKFQVYKLKISQNIITPISIQDVLININFNIINHQRSIQIQYLEIGKEKIFDFIENREFIDPSNPNKSTSAVKIPIKNYNLFETLFEYRTELLVPNSLPFFIFWNVATSKRDEGIDAGGLTKTVFTYLSNSLFKLIFFVKDPETNLFRLKTLSDKELNKDDNKNKLYFIGQLFGLAIKLNLTIQINLDPLLLYQLAHDIDLFNFNKELVLSIIDDYNSELLENMPYLCFDINPDTFISLELKHKCLYNDQGNTIVNFENLELNQNKIINMTEINNIKNETINRIIEEIKEKEQVTEIFVSGFRSQINIKKSKINRLPLNLLNNLISGIVAKDYTTLFKNLQFVNFTPIQQTQLIEILKNQICTNIQSKYISLLIMVMTSSYSIPANGYPPINPLRFEIKNLGGIKPAEIHSCFNQFIINKKLFDDYIIANSNSNSNSNPSVKPNKDTELYHLFDIESLEELKNAFSIA